MTPLCLPSVSFAIVTDSGEGEKIYSTKSIFYALQASLDKNEKMKARHLILLMYQDPSGFPFPLLSGRVGVIKQSAVKTLTIASSLIAIHRWSKPLAKDLAKTFCLRQGLSLDTAMMCNMPKTDFI